ncbi:MAG: LysM peptidoglycan-binding domain-containing protein [Gammaproteobacteria bacterium]|nr:LysM peptidoglycan-binding domain-containing protein [Gammaproteobacteria bacterium]
MPTRFIFSLSLLFLAGCATTGNGTGEAEAPPPELAAEVEAIPSSAPTIDEHLFVPPKLEPLPADPETVHVHDNVWERLTHQFMLPECAEHESAVKWAEWYAARPEYMARIFKRAQPWIYYIADELEQRGLPGELALLPIVESAYDPFAYSSGRALGAWQFISSTGRNYGLNQNWWYDGRRDVWASTDAALRYLSHLGEMFDGDWLLALAGYNSGENRVARQMRKNRKAGKPTDFWNLRLPRETRGYVPKLLGLTCLFKYREQYDFELPDTPDTQVIAAVDLGRQADLVLVAQMAGVPVDVMFTLNPGYNRWATSPDGPFQVVLPVEGAELLAASLERIDPSALMKWDQVVVERGDTLSEISTRHHVPVSVLRSANDLDGDLIRVGQKLRLPRDEQLLVDPLYAQAAMELQNLQSGLIAADRMNHRVRPGESLSVIARRYRVSVRDLQRWNNISDPRTLRAGANITVFRSPAQPSPTSGGTVQYVVQRGDSLWSIAQKYKVDIDDLKNWNGLGGNAMLHPGQSLQIQL